MAKRMWFTDITVFDEVKPDKAQALKVLEEAAEVFAAWQGYDHDVAKAFGRLALIDELADVIQAAANLAWAIGIEDMREPMAACERRNRERGRIDGVKLEWE
jgi:NTP pyrophosphatase (non-canonical NTP hydrolase)